MSRKLIWWKDYPLDWVGPLLMLIAAAIVCLSIHCHRINEVVK